MSKGKIDAKFGRFIGILKKLEVSIPFLDLMTDVPSYPKYIKEILMKKKGYDGVEAVALTEECSSVV